jgi:hypothetical protein
MDIRNSVNDRTVCSSRGQNPYLDGLVEDDFFKDVLFKLRLEREK